LLWPLFQQGVKRADRIEAGAITQFNKLHRLMLGEGVYLAPSGYEVAFLSGAHGDEALARFREAVAAVAPEFRSDGAP
jgi:glutamate-1-semialdehyde 2,1-aminomutase